MKVLVLGFDGRKKSAVPQVLYCGQDADAGRAVHENPPRGVVKTEFYKNPAYNKRAVHDPERDGAPEGELKLALEVKVIDFPFVKGVIALLVDALDDANEALLEAGKEPVVVVLSEELEDVSEEDLAELKKLTDLEAAGKQIKALEVKIEEVSGRLIASEALVKELEAKVALAEEAAATAVRERERVEIERNIQVKGLEDELARVAREQAAGDVGPTEVGAPSGETLELTPEAGNKPAGGKKK